MILDMSVLGNSTVFNDITTYVHYFLTENFIYSASGTVTLNGSIIIGSGVTWGATNIEYIVHPQEARTWLSWEDSYGDTVINNGPYNDMSVITGDSANSEVIDIGNNGIKLFSYDINIFGAGDDISSVYYRGDSVIFNRGDSQPTWQVFVQGNKTWRYVQTKIVG